MAGYLPTLASPMVVGIDTNSWYDPPRRGELDPDSRQPAEHGFLHRDAPTDSTTFTRALVDADPHRSRLLAESRSIRSSPNAWPASKPAAMRRG
jgi:hypothetical protein